MYKYAVYNCSRKEQDGIYFLSIGKPVLLSTDTGSCENQNKKNIISMSVCKFCDLLNKIAIEADKRNKVFDDIEMNKKSFSLVCVSNKKLDSTSNDIESTNKNTNPLLFSLRIFILLFFLIAMMT